jgi:hypothetical protein
MCKVAIMQPYLFPYKGYLELIKGVDKFVIYDDAQWMKGSWINRNFFPDLFTFRVKKHSNYDPINKCYFFDIEADKKDFKKKFPKLNVDKYFNSLHQELNVAENCTRSLRMVCDTLGINTPFYYSSDIPHGKFAEGVVDMVKALGGDIYINAPGGKSLYTQDMFGDIKLEFIETTVSPSILTEI